MKVVGELEKSVLLYAFRSGRCWPAQRHFCDPKLRNYAGYRGMDAH